MHVPSLSVDLHWLIQFIFTALVILIGVGYFLLKNTASKYFVVDANCDSIDSSSSSSPNSSSCESFSGVMPGVPIDGCCAVCGNRSTKHCSRCKAVKYCSESCQSMHWKKEHRSKCKAPGRKTSAFGGIFGVQKQVDKILFPYDEFVKLFNWDKSGPRPCGLINCGNSCFANVVLQCLAHTRPLVAYLMEKGHRRECRRNEWCFLCELQSHLERVTHQQPFSPVNILSHLPSIGGNLGCGKQEDAHEFMRYAIDTMQSICLDENGGEKRIHPKFQETTLIQHIFGGQLQSQVICTQCNQVSNQYENMMDLTVEIQGDAASLEECLDQFTVKEYLHGDNMYRCDGCNDYVKAWKRLTIRQAPNILTIALKRFQSGRFGKLNKKITFPETLNLSPYMSEEGDHTDEYKLFGVVVHVDMLNASFFGHYICYIKDFQGNWYMIDDCKVITVELEDVLSQGAYMLLYSRVSPRDTCLKTFEAPKKQEKLDNSSVEVEQHNHENHINSSSSEQSCSVSVAEDSSSLKAVEDQKDEDTHTETSSFISSSCQALTITSEPITNGFHLEENGTSQGNASISEDLMDSCEIQQVGSSIQPLETRENSEDIRSENNVQTSSSSQDEQSAATNEIEINGSCKENGERSQNGVESGRFGKLNKKITFPETLNLSPYMSEEGDHTDEYKLFGVVVHVDMLNASFFGHYICYIKDFQGNWYMIDDCKVITVELEDVLSQGAYMLLYSRVSPRDTCLKTFEAPKKQEKLDNSSVEVEQRNHENHIKSSSTDQTCSVSVAEDSSSLKAVEDQKYEDTHTETSSFISSSCQALTITSEPITNGFHLEENGTSQGNASISEDLMDSCEIQQVGSSSEDIRSENNVQTSSSSQSSVVEEDEESAATNEIEINGSCKENGERSQNGVEVNEISEMEVKTAA